MIIQKCWTHLIVLLHFEKSFNNRLLNLMEESFLGPCQSAGGKLAFCVHGIGRFE